MSRVCCAGLALAQTELEFRHVGELGSLLAKSAEEFAKRANERLKGKARSLSSIRANSAGDQKRVFGCGAGRAKGYAQRLPGRRLQRA